MSTIQAVNSTPAVVRKPLPAAAVNAPAKGPAPAGDSYVSTQGDLAKAIAAINDAVSLPQMPADAAGKQAWLQDGYARLTRAELAAKTIMAQRGNDNAGTAAIFKQMDLARTLRQADPDRSAEKAYYGALAKPAAALVEKLSLAPVPASVVGQKAWLAASQGQLQRAEAARAVVEDAWLHGAVSLDDLGQLDDQLFKAQCQVDAVKNQLYPPKPGAKASGSHPVFGLTQGVGGFLDQQKDPVSQTAGAVALPFALMFDMLDLLSRPFQALDKLQQK